jgi:hypothetical protein
MRFVEPTRLHRKSGMWGHPQIGCTSCLKAMVGLRPPPFSAHVRWGERGAPIVPGSGQGLEVLG